MKKLWVIILLIIVLVGCEDENKELIFLEKRIVRNNSVEVYKDRTEKSTPKEYISGDAVLKLTGEDVYIIKVNGITYFGFEAIEKGILSVEEFHRLPIPSVINLTDDDNYRRIVKLDNLLIEFTDDYEATLSEDFLCHDLPHIVTPEGDSIPRGALCFNLLPENSLKVNGVETTGLELYYMLEEKMHFVDYIGIPYFYIVFG